MTASSHDDTFTHSDSIALFTLFFPSHSSFVFCYSFFVQSTYLFFFRSTIIFFFKFKFKKKKYFSFIHYFSIISSAAFFPGFYFHSFLFPFFFFFNFNNSLIIFSFFQILFSIYSCLFLFSVFLAHQFFWSLFSFNFTSGTF